MFAKKDILDLLHVNINDKNTKPHNLSKTEIDTFEKTFKISAEPLEAIKQKYRDASTHYWHPETKWIYSLRMGKWISNDYNYLESIADQAGLDLDLGISIDPEDEDDFDTNNNLYKLKREDICNKNSSKTKCIGNTKKSIYYYKLNNKPTQQFCTYCKENCVKITDKDTWSDKIMSSGFFDCTCGDCNCIW